MSTPPIFSLLPLEKVQALIKTATVAEAAGTVGKGLLGFGVGTAAGIGGAAVINKIYKASTGEQIPPHLLVPAATMLGAGMGLAYSMYKAKELEELQHALKARKNESAGGVSRK